MSRAEEGYFGAAGFIALPFVAVLLLDALGVQSGYGLAEYLPIALLIVVLIALGLRARHRRKL